MSSARIVERQCCARRLLCVASASIALAFAAVGRAADAAQPGGTANPGLHAARVAAASAAHAEKAALRDNPLSHRIDGLLRNAIADVRSHPAVQKRSAPDDLVRFNERGEVHCYVHLIDANPANLDALATHGFRAELTVPEMKLAQGWLATDQVEVVANLAFVRKITTPSYGVSRCAGNACSEGDAIHNAPAVRTLGFDGTGVKVGVISDGIKTRASAIASGDLPNTINANPALSDADGDEGTAMLEIVHDLAPGATLYFSGGSMATGVPSSAEMVSGINWLVAQGCNVIVDDIGHFDAPYFEDGPVATAAKNAIAAGVVYCSAAGNECRRHYQGMFTAGNNVSGDITHDFDPGAGLDDMLNITVAGNGRVAIFVEWNDPFGAAGNDYDIRLYNVDTDALVASSLDTQDGNDDPIERISWTNPSASSVNLGLEISNYQGNAAPRIIELFVTRGTLSDPLATCADSVFEHPAVVGVVACTAIDAADPGHDTIENASNHGPSTISFPTPEVRQTPFAAAIDGVAVTGAGGFFNPFFGTSAAAPHAAAIAALLFQAGGAGTTADDVRAAMASSALDRGAAGFDTTFGHGLLDASAAVAALCAPQSAPANVSASDNTNALGVTVTWNAVAGASAYRVLRSATDDAGAASLLQSVNALTFTDATADTGTQYFYFVQASSACGNGPISTGNSGTRGTGGTPPPCGIPLCGAGFGLLPWSLVVVGLYRFRRRPRRAPARFVSSAGRPN